MTRIEMKFSLVMLRRASISGSFVDSPTRESLLRRSTGASITVVRHPVRYNGRAPEIRLPPQPLGGQSRDILTELGFDDAAFNALVKSGIVACQAEQTPDIPDLAAHVGSV
jgi:crotonobetainyl-CoA:carnitine CoA-transferase CaiB-like acyl-CoA transferase